MHLRFKAQRFGSFRLPFFHPSHTLRTWPLAGLPAVTFRHRSS